MKFNEIGLCERKQHPQLNPRYNSPLDISNSFHQNECHSCTSKQRTWCKHNKPIVITHSDIKKVKRIEIKPKSFQIKRELLGGRRQVGIKTKDNPFPQPGQTYEKIVYARTIDLMQKRIHS